MYTHQIRVRYGELDPQGVVFNANYLAYCDDAFDTWLRNALGNGLEQHQADVMLKKAEVIWHSPARLGDVIELEVSIKRWGQTSFDAFFQAKGVFEATITYVCVQQKTTTPMRFPDALRSLLVDT